MKTLFSAFAFALCLCSQGQINVGPIEMPTRDPGEFKEADLVNLRGTKTVFVYRDADKHHIPELKKILSAVWTLTRLEFCSYSEFKTNEYDGSYSFLTIGGYRKVIVPSSPSSPPGLIDYYYLSLWMQNGNAKLFFSRTELFLSYKSREVAREKEGAEFTRYMYEEAEIRNWYLPFLKNGLQVINKALENSEERYLFENENLPGLKEVQNDTLYIPDYVLIKYNKFSGSETKRHDSADLVANYPYPCKFVTTEELTALVLQADRPIYYLSYVKSYTAKYINVIHSGTGEFLYTAYADVGYNIDSKDFKLLAKEIKALSK